MAQYRVMYVEYLGKTLAIPKKMGTISKVFQGNQKAVVCIQDLHCNYEVQKNIARIIHHLAKKHGLKLVGEEGAFHTVDTSKIRTFPVKKIRMEVSDYFVKQGKLTGAEYYAAVSEYPIRLEGIETPSLYEVSQRTVRSFLNTEIQGYCYDLREILDDLKAEIYNPILRKFDAKRMAYREGDLDILKYSVYLHRTARRLQLDLTIYPNLARFVSLNQNFFSPEVDPDQLFQELDKLDTTIRSHFYTSKTQQELDDLYHRLDIIEKLLSISVTREELDEFRSHRQDFSIRVYSEFIQQHDPEGECLLDSEIYMLDKYLQQVDDFYRLADERSLHFVENLLEKMERLNENLAVMINGGFHTDKVLSELKRRNITYISIKPRLTREDVVNPYFDLLRNRQSPLEKLLARNQRILALRTALEDINFLQQLELIFKPLAKVLKLSPEEKEQLRRYLKENQLIDVAIPSQSIAVASGFVKAKNVKIMSTSLKSETGYKVAVLVADTGLIPEKLQQQFRCINSKTIGGKIINLYNSLEEAVRVAAAIKNSERSLPVWLNARVGDALALVKQVLKSQKVIRYFRGVFIAPWQEFHPRYIFHPMKFLTGLHNNNGKDGKLSYLKLVPRILGLILMYGSVLLTFTVVMNFAFVDMEISMAERLAELVLSPLFMYLSFVGMHKVYSALVPWAQLQIEKSGDKYFDQAIEKMEIALRARKYLLARFHLQDALNTVERQPQLLELSIVKQQLQSGLNRITAHNPMLLSAKMVVWAAGLKQKKSLEEIKRNLSEIRLLQSLRKVDQIVLDVPAQTDGEFSTEKVKRMLARQEHELYRLLSLFFKEVDPGELSSPPDRERFHELLSTPEQHRYQLIKQVDKTSPDFPVFLAKDLETNRLVVVKIAENTTGSLDGINTVVALTNEATILRDLAGIEGVVKLLDAKYFQDKVVAAMPEMPAGITYLGSEYKSRVISFIVTEYQGIDLFELVRKYKHSFSPEEVLVLINALLDIYKKIHQRKILHNDPKPENILIPFRQQEGRVTFDFAHPYLIDFAFSTYLPKAGFIELSCFVGRPEYAAPESKKDFIYSPSTDLYALGKALEPLIESVAMKQYPRLREFVDKLTAYNPKQRYQSADEARRDLESITTETKLEKSPGGIMPQVREWYVEQGKSAAEKAIRVKEYDTRVAWWLEYVWALKNRYSAIAGVVIASIIYFTTGDVTWAAKGILLPVWVAFSGLHFVKSRAGAEAPLANKLIAIAISIVNLLLLLPDYSLLVLVLVQVAGGLGLHALVNRVAALASKSKESSVGAGQLFSGKTADRGLIKRLRLISWFSTKLKLRYKKMAEYSAWRLGRLFNLDVAQRAWLEEKAQISWTSPIIIGSFTVITTIFSIPTILHMIGTGIFNLLVNSKRVKYKEIGWHEVFTTSTRQVKKSRHIAWKDLKHFSLGLAAIALILSWLGLAVPELAKVAEYGLALTGVYGVAVAAKAWGLKTRGQGRATIEVEEELQSLNPFIRAHGWLHWLLEVPDRFFEFIHLPIKLNLSQQELLLVHTFDIVLVPLATIWIAGIFLVRGVKKKPALTLWFLSAKRHQLGAMMPWLKSWYVENGMKIYQQWYPEASEAVLEEMRASLERKYWRKAWQIEMLPIAISGLAGVLISLCLGLAELNMGFSTPTLLRYRIGWGLFIPGHFWKGNNFTWKNLTMEEKICVYFSIPLALFNIAFSFVSLPLWIVIFVGFYSHKYISTNISLYNMLKKIIIKYYQWIGFKQVRKSSKLSRTEDLEQNSKDDNNEIDKSMNLHSSDEDRPQRIKKKVVVQEVSASKDLQIRTWTLTFFSNFIKHMNQVGNYDWNYVKQCAEDLIKISCQIEDVDGDSVVLKKWLEELRELALGFHPVSNNFIRRRNLEEMLRIAQKEGRFDDAEDINFLLQNMGNSELLFARFNELNKKLDEICARVNYDYFIPNGYYLFWHSDRFGFTVNVFRIIGTKEFKHIGHDGQERTVQILIGRQVDTNVMPSFERNFPPAQIFIDGQLVNTERIKAVNGVNRFELAPMGLVEFRKVDSSVIDILKSMQPSLKEIRAYFSGERDKFLVDEKIRPINEKEKFNAARALEIKQQWIRSSELTELQDIQSAFTETLRQVVELRGPPAVALAVEITEAALDYALQLGAGLYQDSLGVLIQVLQESDYISSAYAVSMLKRNLNIIGEMTAKDEGQFNELIQKLQSATTETITSIKTTIAPANVLSAEDKTGTQQRPEGRSVFLKRWTLKLFSSWGMTEELYDKHLVELETVWSLLFGLAGSVVVFALSPLPILTQDQLIGPGVGIIEIIIISTLIAFPILHLDTETPLGNKFLAGFISAITGLFWFALFQSLPVFITSLFTFVFFITFHKFLNLVSAKLKARVIFEILQRSKTIEMMMDISIGSIIIGLLLFQLNEQIAFLFLLGGVFIYTIITYINARLEARNAKAQDIRLFDWKEKAPALRSLYGPNEGINKRRYDRFPRIRRWVIMPILGLILSATQIVGAMPLVGKIIQPNLSYGFIDDTNSEKKAEKIQNFNNYNKIKRIKISHGFESEFITGKGIQQGILDKMAARIILKPSEAKGILGWWQYASGYSRMAVTKEGRMEIVVPRHLLASLDLSAENKELTPKKGLETILAKVAEEQLKRIIEHQTGAYMRLIRQGASLTELGLNDMEDVVFYNEFETLAEEKRRVTVLREPQNTMRRILQQKKINIGPAEIIGIFIFLMKQLRPGYSLVNVDLLKEHLSLDTAKKELIEYVRQNKATVNILNEHPYWADIASIETLLNAAKTYAGNNIIKTFLEGFAATEAQPLADMGAAVLILNDISSTSLTVQKPRAETNVNQITTLALPGEVIELMLKEIGMVEAEAGNRNLAEPLAILKRVLKEMPARTGQIVSFSGDTAQSLAGMLANWYAMQVTEKAEPEEAGIKIMDLGKQIEVGEKENIFAVTTQEVQTIKLDIGKEEFVAATPLIGQVKASSESEVREQLQTGSLHILPFTGRATLQKKPSTILTALFQMVFLNRVSLILIKRISLNMHIHLLKICGIAYVESQLSKQAKQSTLWSLLKTESRFQELLMLMANAKNRRQYYRQQKAFVNYMRKYMARYYYDIYGDNVSSGKLKYISEAKMLENYLNLKFFDEIMHLGAVVAQEDIATLKDSVPESIRSMAPTNVAIAAVLVGGNKHILKGKTSYGTVGAFTEFLRKHYYEIAPKFEGIFDRMRKRMHKFAGSA